MKRLVAIAFLMTVVAGSAMASAELVKQRAQRVRDQNNQQQGIAPPSPGAPRPAPGASSTPQGIDPAQQQLIDKLQQDLTAIKVGAQVSPAEEQQLREDCLTLAKGATKPSKPSVTKLVHDLSAALSDKNVTGKSQPQLARYVNIVVNCANLSPSQVQTFVKASQTVLKASGAPEQAATAVVADLKAIVAELQKNKS